MRGFVYNEHDFGEYVRVQVLETGAHAVVPESLVVPGRTGEVLLGGRLGVKRIVVRMVLDVGFRVTSVQLSEIRHTLMSWLCAANGAELVLPDDGGLTYRDVICTDAGVWSSAHADAFCDVGFSVFDPVAYGKTHSFSRESFEVKGTWVTYPTVTVVAAAGNEVSVSCGNESVSVTKAFSGGEIIVMNFAKEAVTIDGIPAEEYVTLDSNFFALEPGKVNLKFTESLSHSVSYTERWL